jgi:hypothetical protein
MSITADMSLKQRQGADIWLGDGEGGIRRSRKPHLTLVDDTRAGVLRQIADWIEQQDDPDLTAMAAEIEQKKADRNADSNPDRGHQRTTKDKGARDLVLPHPCPRLSAAAQDYGSED